MKTRSVLAIVLAVMATVTVTVAAPTATADRAASCRGSVVLVHDIASSASDWIPMARALADAGWCPMSFTYGRTPLTEALRPVGDIAGLDSLESSAARLRDVLDEVRADTGEEAVRVVAHGAGGLIAQRMLHDDSAGPVATTRVSTLTTLGPMWNGTDIAGLGSIAAVNRRIGIYDALASIERPLVGPLCSACGEIVTGSTFLTGFPAAQPVPGVRYVDVATTTDGLVTDPTGSPMPGSTRVVVQEKDPSSRVDHRGLPADPVVLHVVASDPGVS